MSGYQPTCLYAVSGAVVYELTDLCSRLAVALNSKYKEHVR